MDLFDFKRAFKNAIPYTVGILVLGLTIYLTGPKQIIYTLSKVDLKYFFYASLPYLVIEVLAVMKLKLTLPIGFLKLFLSHEGGMFLSQITPGRAGYLYTPYSVARKGKKSISKMIGLVSLIEGAMMISKIIMIGISIIYFSYYFKISNYFYLSFLFPILIFIGMILVLYSDKTKSVLSVLPKGERLARYVELMQSAARNVPIQTILKFIVLDIAGWTFYSLQFFFLGYALGIHIPYLTCLMLQPLLTALLYIPVSPSALGIAESGSALLFNLIGLGSEKGVVFLLLFRISTMFVDSVGLIDLRKI